jgi:hypothetical protein
MVQGSKRFWVPGSGFLVLAKGDAIVNLIRAIAGSLIMLLIQLQIYRAFGHWRAHNVMMRVFGLLWGLGAFVAWAEGLYFLIHPGQGEEFEVGGLSASVSNGLAGVVFLLVAAIVLTRRPYRPDLGDARFSDRNMRLLWGLPKNWTRKWPNGKEEISRNWWTGDPKP